MSATKVNKPTVKRIIKSMGIDPVGLDITKNNYWTVKPFSVNAKAEWKAIHSTIAQVLTNEGIRFCDYGHAIQIYL